ncbi:MAG: hypothetical protein LQ345_006546 [Seirophora villosa]|nr:MAG: hypothetical protein LQ345_006546 [Seirophora villosa]
MAGAPIAISPSGAWDGNDGPWSTFAMGFGTPPQYVRVLISTTCSQPWAVDPLGCTARDPADCGSDRGGIFEKNKSSTWQGQGVYGLDQSLNLGYTGNGDFGLDTVTLGYPGSASGATAMEHQLLATVATTDFYVATWGIVPRPTNLSGADPQETIFDPKRSYPSLLSTLKEQYKIPSLSFGYTAGARYRLKREPASLTLGGYDASRFVPSDITFSFASDRDLVVGIQSILVDGTSRELLPTSILALIDSTVPHIWLPLDACCEFERAFGISWDRTSDLYLVNETTHQALLAQNANLTFKIGSQRSSTDTIDITLPYASFDLQVLDTYPNIASSTRYFPLRRAANDTQYTLGRTFLQEAYLIADYERSTFSVNQCRFDEKAAANIHPIFPTNNTIGTNATTPTNPDPGKDADGLSPGVIAAIVLALVGFLTILGISGTVLRRRKRRDKEAKQSEPDEDSVIPNIADMEGERELHSDERPRPELQGISVGPLEMEDEVAAVEMHVVGNESYELP